MPTLKIQKADGTFEFLQLAGEEFADIGNQVLDVKEHLQETEADLLGRGFLVSFGSNALENTTAIEQAFSQHNTVLIPVGEHPINGLTIPDGKTLKTVGETTFYTTGTILVGASVMDCPHLTVNAEAVTTDEFSIIKVSKNSDVTVLNIRGYRQGSVRGDGTVARAIDATHSDFINIKVLGRIRQCKYGLFLNGGATGSGNTINGSFFFVKHIGTCKYAVYQEGSTMENISIYAYVEVCDVGYSCRGSIYGIHNLVFDDVTIWFENRNTSWKTRLGSVHLENRQMSTVLSMLDGEFYDTKFFCRDGIITSRPSTSHTPTLQSDARSKVFLKSGGAELRLISSGSNTFEGKKSVNDTPGGTTSTLGGSSSHFIVESNSEQILLQVLSSGRVNLRRSLKVGDGSNPNDDLEVTTGDLVTLRSDKGLVLTSPDGSKWRQKIDNSGVTSWVKI